MDILTYAMVKKIINNKVPNEGKPGNVLTKTADGQEWASPAGATMSTVNSVKLPQVGELYLEVIENV